MRVIDAWQIDVVLGNERPDVEFGPVRDGEYSEVFALVVAAVVDAP